MDTNKFEFLIRPVKPKDLPALNALALTLFFANLPKDPSEMEEKVHRSGRSFKNKNLVGEIPEFFFVLVDNTDTLLGTSLILSKHGTPDDPHTYFQTERVEHFSQELHSGVIHETLNLKFEENGPTEIGGLIIEKILRQHPRKLGKSLSFVRFNFMKRFPQYFQSDILAEMMAPVSPTGENVLWEAVGRNFTNLSYSEADKFSIKHKEMIRSLFPKTPIYLTLLAPDVRHSIGEVGKATIPAKRLLESQGFKYTGQLDPFDGGPHLRCKTQDIVSVKATSEIKNFKDKDLSNGLISFGKEAEFYAIPSPTAKNLKDLEEQNITSVFFTPY